MECQNLTELASKTHCGTLTLYYDSFWPSVVWFLTSTITLFVIMCFVVTCIKIMITGNTNYICTSSISLYLAFIIGNTMKTYFFIQV